jgi:hypothetical protein
LKSTESLQKKWKAIRIRWVLAGILVLCELFFAARMSLEWIQPSLGWFILGDTRFLLGTELLLRGAWLLMLIFFVRTYKKTLPSSGKRLLTLTTVGAGVLFLLTFGSLISWLSGLKFAMVNMVRYKIFDVTWLLLWGLALLFVLTSSDLKPLWRARGRVWATALGGTVIYCIFTGFIWLQYVSGPITLQGGAFRVMGMVLPLLILAGRLALIALLAADRESGDTGAGK